MHNAVDGGRLELAEADSWRPCGGQTRTWPSLRPCITRVLNQTRGLTLRKVARSASIINDFLIALWFVLGSVFFLFEALVTAGTVLFLLGSLQFAARPVIRLRRRVHLKKITGGAPTETSRDF
jgi:hypothetical protein